MVNGRPSGEQGAVMVTVALALPVLILFASFVIDVGNWFVHQRHLQLQADAGALAAAGDIRYPACDEEAIKTTANKYSGTEGGIYNEQVGGTPSDKVLFALNSLSYPEQPSKLDPNPVEGPPCQSGTIDVKLAETDLPLFFRVASLFSSIDFINAHARVQVFKKERLTGALPVAVPDPNPRKARVIFIDEENGGAEIENRELIRDGSEGNLAIWDNASDPLLLPVKSERIGVRIVLSGGDSTNCGDPLVQCYPEDLSKEVGLLFVRGYSTAGSGAQPGAPLARDAYLLEGTCDRYFSSEEEGCAVGLHADVDFGPCEGIEEKVGPELEAVVGNETYPLELEPEPEGCPAGTSTSRWRTSGAPIPVPKGEGPVSVELKWTETNGELDSQGDCSRGNGCSGSFGVVQRSFAGNKDLSGPIRLVQIEDSGGRGANSFERCPSCTYPVTVRIGIDQNLQENAKNPDELPVQLRVEGSTSQTHTLDCDPELANLSDELANGCAPEYAINQGTPCPRSQTELEREPEPWKCVGIQTGEAIGQVGRGMNERVHGEKTPDTCVNPNHWPDYEPGDPRIMPVFITAFGAFNGTGNETVPVTDFATFYVTGWRGAGKGEEASSSICSGEAGETPDDEAVPGTILGHFIRYVQTLNDGSAGETLCNEENFEDFLTPCVAVMTE